jgi:hypothetical protein
MFTITVEASAHLAKFLNSQGPPAEIAVRFVHRGEAVAVQPDEEREGDKAFQHEGRTVLVLDAQMLELLADDALDVENYHLTLQQPPKGE